MCDQFAGEVGEVEIYDGYKKKPTSKRNFQQFLCHGDGLLGECSKVEEAKKKAKQEL